MSCIENVIYKTWVNDVIMLIFRCLLYYFCHCEVTAANKYNIIGIGIVERRVESLSY